MVTANSKPVAKISDEPAKSMCEDDEYLKYLASVYGINHVVEIYPQPSNHTS